MLNIDERSSIHFSLKLPFSVFQSGGFYSAEDADSLPTHESKEKKEGAFCVWTYDDIYAVLTDDVKNGVKSADVFSFHYDVRKQGNVDPYQVALLIFNFSSNPSICSSENVAIVLNNSVQRIKRNLNVTIRSKQ